MIDHNYVKTMAAYNRWQNDNTYSLANELSDEQRRQELGSFFGSIHKTSNHLLWGDTIWMSRFSNSPAPIVATIGDSSTMFDDWADFLAAREQMDKTISEWSAKVTDEELQGDLSYYSGAAAREICKPLSLLVVHMFNHETHHRGQIHTMLTIQGLRTKDTDLPLMP